MLQEKQKRNYRVGQTVKLDNNEDNSKKWPQEETLLPIKNNGELLAKYEVKQVDSKYIYGKITTTYGHKRRNNE